MTHGRVVYSCPFVPAEWVQAHGFAPSRIIPRLSVAFPNAGVCAYAQAFADTAAREDAAAIVVTTVCDQMRRSAEKIAASTTTPVFLMNVPHTWQCAGSRKLYRDEVERLGRFLVSVGGEPASNESLTRAMNAFEEARACVLPSAPAQGVPVTVLGGPPAGEAYEILDLIECTGGQVVLDGTETGERTLPAPFDRRKLDDDPLDALCEAYFGIPDPARRPNSEFFDWLGRMIEDRGIRGVIVVYYLWCDIWRAESRRIAEWSKLPMLPLDLGGLDLTRARHRLEAFFEVIK